MRVVFFATQTEEKPLRWNAMFQYVRIVDCRRSVASANERDRVAGMVFYRVANSSSREKCSVKRTKIHRKLSMLAISPMMQLSLLATAGLLACGGCSSGPSRLVPPSISASGAAEQAMEMYDVDSDGYIAGDELKQAHGLRAAMKTVDTDNDEKISELEIAERIRVWQSTKAGISSILCSVTMDGKPLEGATVTFEPEPFLGDEIQTASGPTNYNGTAAPYIPKENRPQADMPPGLQLGFYRVKISKLVNGKEIIPEKYNSETTLGQQVANDDPAILKRQVVFKLKKR
jgi:hypothetical protein